MDMLAEIVILSTMTTVLGSLWLADRVMRRQ